jgi:hypothetical protein
MKAKDKTRIRVIEMTFMRQAVKYTCMDYKRNEDILKVLKTKPIVDKILKCKN